MPVYASFLDGPLQGDEHERCFVGLDALPQRLFFAPIEFASTRWQLVGMTGTIDEPWPDQVEYRLANERSVPDPSDLDRRALKGFYRLGP